MPPSPDIYIHSHYYRHFYTHTHMYIYIYILFIILRHYKVLNRASRYSFKPRVSISDFGNIPGFKLANQTNKKKIDSKKKVMLKNLFGEI